MACSTCNCTMQNIGASDRRVFWCPTCGTLSTISGEHREDEPPTFARTDAETYRSAERIVAGQFGDQTRDDLTRVAMAYLHSHPKREAVE